MKSLVQMLSLIGLLAGSSASSESATSLPPSLIAYEKPAYPAELQAAAVIDGYATVAFIVEGSGSVSDAVVLEASHVAFGRSVLDALPKWRFNATPENSLPKREVIRFDFASKGVVTSISHRDASKSAFPLTVQQRTPIRTVLWSDLTMPPSRLSAPAPALPKNSQGNGKIEVSYVIDSEGKVRVPVIVNTTQPNWGLATLAAVKQWRFEPPMQDGMPVLVEDARSFSVGSNP
jgi:TonB family protein